MTLNKYTKIVLLTVLAGATASLIISQSAGARVRNNVELLRQLESCIMEAAFEHGSPTNRLTEASDSTSEEPNAELEMLRNQAEALRAQVQARAGKGDRKVKIPPASSSSAAKRRSSVGGGEVESDSDSEEYKVQLYRMSAGKNNRNSRDARNLGSAVRKYARENQGQLPTNFEQAAPYYDDRRTVLRAGELVEVEDREAPQTSEFEIVYQGSLNELTNIPLKAVALIRQRQAWPTPEGKWGRIYILADGQFTVVESDDDFQSWETEHIIPPPGQAQ